MIDANGYVWKDNEVVCEFEICTDGSIQWEMIRPAKAECGEYFATKEELKKED